MAEDKKEREPFRKLENFDGFIESLYRPNRSAAPFYSNSADYNTNSKSYYDDLSRKAKLFEILAHRIWEYDEELAKRFEEWDQNLEDFPENVEKLLIKWLEDGTLDDIINENIFKDLNHDINLLKIALSENEKKDLNQDKEINTLGNRITSTTSELNDRLDHIISPSPIDVVENVTELNDKYPNGANGVVVVKSDGFYYYYQSGSWHKGGEYVGSHIHQLVKSDGTVQNLNNEEYWINNPDITSLNTGFYSAFIQSEEINKNYPIIKNAPKDIKGAECLIKVFKHDFEDRKDFEIVVNFSNAIYTASKGYNGALTDWKAIVKTDSKNPIQQYALTYYSGGIRSLFNVDPINESNRLNMKITDLPTGFFYGQITDNNNAFNRNLPHDIIYGAYYTFIVFKTEDNRTSITLHDNTSDRSWICYNTVNGENLVWKRLDTNNNEMEREQNKFSYRVNRLSDNNNFKNLIITDTHLQHLANTNQIGSVNTTNIEDFYTISDSLKNNDASIHLGDWIDGNFPKEHSAYSAVKLSKDFYSKPKRYGIFGNHDFNGQYDGFSGQNGIYKHDPRYIFDKKDMNNYYVPDKKDYYYVDNIEKRVRMIFINNFDISYKKDENGQLIEDALNTPAVGAAQIKWLVNTLKSVPKTYNVVVYGHTALNNVFTEQVFPNGDLTRKVLEAYQNKEQLEVFTTGITETEVVYDYYKIEENVSFNESKGKIMCVINGHRHKDETIFKNGIRYIGLLCSRAESGTTEEKPPRPYHEVERNAITFLDYDLDNEEIKLLRYGAGIDRTIKMYE